jgi:hypothetical protein
MNKYVNLENLLLEYTDTPMAEPEGSVVLRLKLASTHDNDKVSPDVKHQKVMRSSLFWDVTHLNGS